MWNRRILAFLALAGAAALSSCEDEPSAPPAPPAPGRVTGTIAGWRVPVGRVAVFLADESSWAGVASASFTDGAGHFEIPNVPAGRYIPCLYFADSLAVLARSADRIEVFSGQTTQYIVFLIPSELWRAGPYYVAGRVVDDASGTPVSGAYVSDSVTPDLEVLSLGATVPWIGVTDEGGRFAITANVFEDLNTTGILPISVTKLGYEPFSLVGTGPDSYGLGSLLPLPPVGDTLNVTLRLRPAASTTPTGSLAGHVWTVSARPVAGVRVGVSLSLATNADTLRTVAKGGADIRLLSPVPGAVATTDANGWFQIDGLRPGQYYIVPALSAGDGYHADYGFEPYSVAPGDTTLFGSVRVLATMQPLAPLPGAIYAAPSVELRWQALEPVTLPYDSLVYEVQVSTGFRLDPVALVTEPRFTVGPFEFGTTVRWIVQAWARNTRTGFRERIGTMEPVPWFHLGPPPTTAPH